MAKCKNCRSSNSYSGCPDTTTSDCVKWQGGDIECLGICNGDMLTDVENTFAENICALLSTTDMSSVEIPECLRVAWGTKDPTILNLINFLLQEHCNLNTKVDGIDTELQTFDPLITVDYKCCSDNPCVTTGTVKLSIALQNIINCLCTQKQLIDEQSATISDLNDKVESLSTQVENFGDQLSTLTTGMAALSGLLTGTYRNKINCIINGTGLTASCPPL